MTRNGVLNRAEYLSRWSELHGHARPGRVVGGWLFVAYTMARPLALLRVSPDLISISGLLAAVGALLLAMQDQFALAAAVILSSLILDGLDGAVAVLRRRESAWGGVLDGFVDRIGEAVWAATLVVVGVPIPLALAGWILAMVQEYQRARLASLHESTEPIAVTVCERPVRALLLASAVLMGQASLPLSDQITPTLFAGVWLVLQSVGAVQVWHSARVLRSDLAG